MQWVMTVVKAAPVLENFANWKIVEEKIAKGREGWGRTRLGYRSRREAVMWKQGVPGTQSHHLCSAPAVHLKQKNLWVEWREGKKPTVSERI